MAPTRPSKRRPPSPAVKTLPRDRNHQQIRAPCTAPSPAKTFPPPTTSNTQRKPISKTTATEPPSRCRSPTPALPKAAGEVLVPPLEAAGLAPDTAYVYRLVATNKFGTSFGENQPFTTFQPPTIEGFFTSHVTATSADLEAKINPQGFTTECHFEYGTTDFLWKSTHPAPNRSRETKA